MNPFRNVWFLLMIAAVALTAGSWWLERSRLMAAEAIASPEEVGTQGEVPANEEAWIRHGVLGDLTQLMAFAATVEKGGDTNVAPPMVTVKSGTGAGEAQTFTVTAQRAGGSSFTQEFKPSGSPWNPGTYLPWAQALAAAGQVRVQAGAIFEENLVERLTEPTMKNFLEANARLSDALTKSPANSDLHEEAGLLLTALAWSEAAGNFSDSRDEMNAACAHLAMAETLRAGQPAGIAGKLAEATLLMLTGREADATRAVDALAAGDLPKATQEWVEALRLANYGDWRKYTPARAASLLWRREYYRSLVENISPDAGLAYFGTMSTADEPDWGRIALGRRFSVGVGNTFAQSAVQREVDEINQVRQAVAADGAADTSAEGLLRFLNETDAGPWAGNRLAVVSQGLWAARAQRHFLGTLAETYHHFNDMLGVPEVAAQFRQMAATPTMRGLHLGPFLSYYLAANQMDYDAAMDAVTALLREHPEWVTAANWREARTPPSKWQSQQAAPEYTDWFNPWLPNGTTYDTVNRLSFDEMMNLSTDTFQGWQVLAPHKLSIALGLLHAQYGDEPTPEQVAAGITPMQEYNLVAAMKVADASRSDSAKFQEAMKLVCALDPQQYLEMGRTLEDDGNYDAAAIAYQKAVDLAPDRVGVASEMEFLVNYYYDHGQRDLALKTAQMAADVYSCAGLQVMMRLDLRMGKFPAALAVAQQIAERYGNTEMYLVVYSAWQRATGEEEAKREAGLRMLQIFPNGEEALKLADLTQAAAPGDGTQLQGDSYFTDHYGLRKGDVVVGINGQRARNLAQYYALLDMSDTVSYDIIYWHDGQYGEQKFYLPDRRFDVTADTYRP